MLGVNVDVLGKGDVIKTILSWLKEDDFRLKHIVTAYSEFFVTAAKDAEFRKVINEADLVTPDGVSVLAAIKYNKLVKKGDGIVDKLFKGLGVGLDVLKGDLGETVTGVWLFEELCRVSGKKRHKVFLLGGWGGVAGRAATMLLKRFPGIRVASDEGEQMAGQEDLKNERAIKAINRFKPDILFVAYSPVKQEKWIAKHREVLKAKVAVGVGGTFDEFVGDLPGSPEWMSKSGLKWLWRLWLQPKRLGRIVRAVVVFPWLVFKESLS